MNENSDAPRVHSSRTVFLWMGALLIAMTGFMFASKQLGILNPRATWDLEFQNLKDLVLDFHRQDDQPDSPVDAGEVSRLLGFYAGSQLKLRSGSAWQPVGLDARPLNGKPVQLLKFRNLSISGSTGVISFAIFPIAVRQMQKTFKFVDGSFLWHAFRWDGQGTSYVVKSENETLASGQIHLIAANYLNDYFLLVAGRATHRDLARSVSEALSFYHDDVIRTL